MDVDNNQDILDSRDIIERIDELKDDIEVDRDAGEPIDQETQDELAILLAPAAEAEASAEDWSHGETLIRESYFAEYAEETAYDIGAVDRDARWPVNLIDWDAAAEQLQVDYFDVDFDGVTYWIRG